MTPALSYAHGTSATPLLGETIGENLRRTVERFGDREALVVRSQDYRATYRQLWDATTQVARGLLALGVEKGDRVGIWAPNRFEWVVVQYATARIGAILVNINPAYKTAELEYALDAVRRQRAAAWRAASGRADYARDAGGGARPAARGLREALVLDDDWEPLLASGDARERRGRWRTREASLQFDDPINIQYTSGTTGFPKGATLSHHNILNNGFFVGEALRLRTERTASASRCRSTTASAWCWATWPAPAHGACMVDPGRGVRPARGAGDGAGRALHVALRRADHVHRRAGPPALRRVRPVVAAHRHHGRLAVPGRGDEAGRSRGCTCARSPSATA